MNRVMGREQEGPAQLPPLLHLQWGASNGVGPVQRLRALGGGLSDDLDIYADV